MKFSVGDEVEIVGVPAPQRWWVGLTGTVGAVYDEGTDETSHSARIHINVPYTRTDGANKTPNDCYQFGFMSLKHAGGPW